MSYFGVKLPSGLKNIYNFVVISSYGLCTWATRYILSSPPFWKGSDRLWTSYQCFLTVTCVACAHHLMIILLRTVRDLILTPWYWFTYALSPALDQWLPASWLRPESWVQYVSDIRKTNVSEEPGLVTLISIQQCSSSNTIHLSQWILILNKTK